MGGVHLHHTPEYPFCRNSELVLSWKQFLMLKSLKAYWLISLRNIKEAGKSGNYVLRNKYVPATGHDFYHTHYFILILSLCFILSSQQLGS